MQFGGKELSQYGHVAIILSADAHSFVSMDQKTGQEVVRVKGTHNYNKFWGVIRPNFRNHIQILSQLHPSIWKTVTAIR